MTVKEMIERLLKEDGDRLVVIGDSGNTRYYPLTTICPMSFDPQEEYVGLEELDEDAVKQGYTEEDLMDKTPALILF
jgi:hypothetical protein